MPISDDEVKTLLNRTARIETEQRRHGRTLYGDDEYPGLRKIVAEVKDKTENIDIRITGYENSIRGAKWVIGGVVFLLTSGAVAAVINIVSGG
jgi:hypothetical protein